MAIKDIFTMIKADRYTSDGREELIKAQEAVTEDVTYKPGDISRKTGLQKQPDGSWAPVKNAPAQKKGLGGKTLTKGAKHYPTVGEYAENGPIEQRMAMKKLLEKNDTESGSGVPIKGDNWFSLPSGTRITHEGAKEKMAQNNARIETLKKAMEGKSKADNFRLGAELKRLQNENDYISERLPPEQSAPGWRAPGSESDPNTEGSIAWYAQQAKKSPSASGSAPSADWEKDIPNASNEELENIVKLEEKLPRMSEQSKSEFAPKIEKAKAELAKRGETVTKMSDLVAQKSRPESAPTGRQPTPEMLEREKMRKSPEAKARRDKLDAEHPRTETGAPSGALKEQTPEEIQEIGRAGRAWRESLKKDAEERQTEVQKALAEQMKKEANSSDIKIRGMDKDNYIFNTMMERHIPREKAEESWNQEVERVQKLRAESSAPSELKIQGMSKEEYIPWRMKTYKENEAQASSVWNHFAEQQKNKGNENGYDPDFHPLRDSAPRVLTGDCKVRIKKSK